MMAKEQVDSILNVQLKKDSQKVELKTTIAPKPQTQAVVEVKNAPQNKTSAVQEKSAVKAEPSKNKTALAAPVVQNQTAQAQKKAEPAKNVTTKASVAQAVPNKNTTASVAQASPKKNESTLAEPKKNQTSNV